LIITGQHARLDVAANHPKRSPMERLLYNVGFLKKPPPLTMTEHSTSCPLQKELINMKNKTCVLIISV
jgi:hypothetical protein